METVRENVAALNAARAAVLAHCMCFKFTEQRDRFVVLFPEGYAVQGARMRFAAEGVSKRRALELLLATMEKYWKLS